MPTTWQVECLDCDALFTGSNRVNLLALLIDHYKAVHAESYMDSDYWRAVMFITLRSRGWNRNPKKDEGPMDPRD